MRKCEMPPAFARRGQMGIPLYKFNIGRYAVKKNLTVYELTLFLLHIFQLIRSVLDREPEFETCC